MAPSDIALWTTVLSAAASIVAGVMRLISMQIQARHKEKLWETALADAEPDQRREIIDSMAGTEPFHPSRRWWSRNEAVDPPPDDDDPPPQGRRGRRR